VPSPKVPTYDHQPEMSAEGVTDAVVAELAEGDLSLVVANFANCDMVGHTGSFDAAARAVETVDRSLARILPEAERRGWNVFITADHGNAEEMKNPDGSPQTAHTTLPVPFVHAAGDAPGERLERGILADVAPTVLDAMGLPKPAAMTGRSLLRR
jgi:2,3-bisphosphoglycerate-independent phosphoglycerate mutase